MRFAMMLLPLKRSCACDCGAGAIEMREKRDDEAGAAFNSL
jgi:hypothetical protein